MKNILLFLLLVLFSTCKQTPTEIPARFSNYEHALNTVEKGSFAIDETTDTSESDWITSAHYVSNDGNKGFLVLGMKEKEYIFADVPLQVWEDFKDAEMELPYTVNKKEEFFNYQDWKPMWLKVIHNQKTFTFIIYTKQKIEKEYLEKD